jgi:hypothetical protein
LLTTPFDMLRDSHPLLPAATKQNLCGSLRPLRLCGCLIHPDGAAFLGREDAAPLARALPH